VTHHPASERNSLIPNRNIKQAVL